MLLFPKDEPQLQRQFGGCVQVHGRRQVEQRIGGAEERGGAGHGVLTAMRLQLAHLGAHVVGRQLSSNSDHPAKDDSIADLITRLHHIHISQP